VPWWSVPELSVNLTLEGLLFCCGKLVPLLRHLLRLQHAYNIFYFQQLDWSILDNYKIVRLVPYASIFLLDEEDQFSRQMQKEAIS
jgi:hypothetical protein